MDKKDIYLYIKSIKGISSITLGKIIDEVGSIEEIVKLNVNCFLYMKITYLHLTYIHFSHFLLPMALFAL